MGAASTPVGEAGGWFCVLGAQGWERQGDADATERKNPPSHPNGFCWLRGLTQRKWGKELVCIKLKTLKQKVSHFLPRNENLTKRSHSRNAGANGPCFFLNVCLMVERLWCRRGSGAHGMGGQLPPGVPQTFSFLLFNPGLGSTMRMSPCSLLHLQFGGAQARGENTALQAPPLAPANKGASSPPLESLAASEPQPGGGWIPPSQILLAANSDTYFSGNFTLTCLFLQPPG